MSCEVTQGTSEGIQGRILNDIEARLQKGASIPGFVVDSLARMHPLDVSGLVDGNIVMPEGFDEDTLAATETGHAWRLVSQFMVPTMAPYKDPIALHHKTKMHPDVAREISTFDAMASLVSQRQGLEKGFVFSGQIVSEELFTGNEDAVSVTDAIRGMLYYHANTVPDRTVLQRPLIDTTSIRTSEGIITDEKFSPEIVVCIPVANGEERDTLPKTLRLLAEQSLDKDKFEIVLLHNSRIPDEAEDGSGDPTLVGLAVIDELIAEQNWLFGVYEELLQNFPDLKIRGDLAIHDERVSIGYCRMRMGEVAAVSYMMRGATNNPLLLHMDADTQSLNKDYLSNILVTAEQTDAPVIGTRAKWQAPEGQVVGPNTDKLLRFSSFMYAAGCALRGTVNYMDCGTAIRLKEYCLAGGHYWPQSFSETLRIAQIIDKTRRLNERDDAIVPSRGSVFGSDPRRQIDVLAKGHAPIRAWEKDITTFGVSDDQVRTQQAPYEQAEAVASTELDRLIEDTVERSFGKPDSKAFLAKADVVRKGLAIIGLPTPDSLLEQTS